MQFFGKEKHVPSCPSNQPPSGLDLIVIISPDLNESSSVFLAAKANFATYIHEKIDQSFEAT